MPTKTSEATLDKYEVAEWAGVKPSTVLRWVRKQRLKAYRPYGPGSHYKFKSSDVTKFLASLPR